VANKSENPVISFLLGEIAPDFQCRTRRAAASFTACSGFIFQNNKFGVALAFKAIRAMKNGRPKEAPIFITAKHDPIKGS
jgi:hypothetical protein